MTPEEEERSARQAQERRDLDKKHLAERAALEEEERQIQRARRARQRDGHKVEASVTSRFDPIIREPSVSNADLQKLLTYAIEQLGGSMVVTWAELEVVTKDVIIELSQDDMGRIIIKTQGPATFPTVDGRAVRMTPANNKAPAEAALKAAMTKIISEAASVETNNPNAKIRYSKGGLVT